MSGEVDDIDACLMDAANDTLLEDCWGSTDVGESADGTKSFKFDKK